MRDGSTVSIIVEQCYKGRVRVLFLRERETVCVVFAICFSLVLFLCCCFFVSKSAVVSRFCYALVTRFVGLVGDTCESTSHLFFSLSFIFSCFFLLQQGELVSPTMTSSGKPFDTQRLFVRSIIV